jgi:large conductance mechanosensitive channel
VGIISEFKEFIAKGNVIDLAVGVVIGAAFSDITKSLVDKVVMPPIGLLLSGVDFSELKVVLQEADPATKAAEVAIQYGAFINTVIQFLIIAFVVFMMVKVANGIRRKEAEAPAAPAAPTADQVLLSEIRDLLKSR